MLGSNHPDECLIPDRLMAWLESGIERKRFGSMYVADARERRTRTALRHLERRARRHRCRSRSVNGISAEDGLCGHRCSRRAGHRGLHEATGHLGGRLAWGRSR